MVTAVRFCGQRHAWCAHQGGVVGDAAEDNTVAEAAWAGVVVVDGVSEILPREGDRFVDGLRTVPPF
jgi:hypothetical protein